uniref:Cytosolic iron-sulfur assembly component 2B n=1 Tax=Oryzias latipes TaxID=8090 RepID=A0A3B3IKL7_ORYLA
FRPGSVCFRRGFVKSFKSKVWFGFADVFLSASVFLNYCPHLIRSISDPEHPLSLEELNVVEQVRVQVNDAESTVSVEFTPTIPHCSMATLIGLSIKVKLLRSLPNRFKIDVHITPGTHASEAAVNKQLADKERVAAALENSSLLEVVNQCLTTRSV